MVQAEHLGTQLAMIDLQPAGDLVLGLVGAVTDPDDTLEAQVAQGLSDQPGRIGEVEQPGFGAIFIHERGIGFDGRNAAHRHGKTAGTGGLLAEHTVFQGDLLVEDAARLIADSDGGHDVGGAVEGSDRVAGVVDANRTAHHQAYLAADGGKYLELVRVDIH